MTVNEMIYKTLNTKITKEPKYKNVLEKLGLDLILIIFLKIKILKK